MVRMKPFGWRAYERRCMATSTIHGTQSPVSMTASTARSWLRAYHSRQCFTSSGFSRPDRPCALSSSSKMPRWQ
jgi:hypothetical protein